jgi:hypothetical protein
MNQAGNIVDTEPVWAPVTGMSQVCVSRFEHGRETSNFLFAPSALARFFEMATGPRGFQRAFAFYFFL